MEERRKITIPINSEDEPGSPRSFFNTEATRTARPVVPIPATGSPDAKLAGLARPARRWPLAVGIVLAAAAVGIAAGLGISVYQNRQESSGASAAVLPVAVKAPRTLPWTHTPEDELAIDEAAEVEPGTEDSQPPTPPSSEPPPARAAVPDKTEKPRDDSLETDPSIEDDRVANSERRKREREQRRNRRNQQRDDDLPQDPLKRSTDELNRIREIFEGTP
jgi:hypothetical protein